MSPSPSPSPAARELRSLDPRIWRSCAGTAVRIPAVGSAVYYFPQGHAEQSPSPPDFSALSRRVPYIRCRIAGVRFLANPDTDEVFAKMMLDPRPSLPPPPLTSPEPDDLDGGGGGGGGGVVAFAKILTPSDANNGGGFSVPRFCADSIFPLLDFTADPPVQNISVCDVHGVVWSFRHIYRGTPRRHLLTTGWSKFVNSKKLVAGDSVVFIRNRAGELFVGIRRAARSCGRSMDYMKYAQAAAEGAAIKLEEDVGAGEGFSRNVKGRVPAESVVEAVRLAEMSRPFEVVYYPRAGSPNFVIAADVVEAAMKVCWTAGTRIKMSVETEDSSRMTWFQGTVSGALVQDPCLWPGSPWRMLQVTWDDSEVLQNVKNVNPWEVMLASPSPHIQAPYPPLKKLRGSPSSELPNNGEGNMYFPLTGFHSHVMGNISPSLFTYGIQGTRHDSSYESSLSNLILKTTHSLNSDNFNGNKTKDKNIDVSTKLSIGSTSQSECSSPQSQGSNIQYYGTDLFGAAICNSTKPNKGSFQLFGQIIQIERPFDDTDKEHKEADNAVPSVNFSFPYHQRVSTLEACSL